MIVSRQGGTFVLLFLILSFLARFVFPFGDEPDFSVRASYLISLDFSIWNPYSILEPIMNKLHINSSCSIESSPFSIVSHIQSEGCYQDLGQTLLRFFLNTIVMSPLLFMIIFRKRISIILSFLRITGSQKEFQLRLLVLSFTITFPSVVFYLGVLSIEQLTLFFSFFIFLFFEKLIVVLIFLFFICLLDPGNGFVVIFFYFNTFFLRKIHNNYGLKYVFFAGIAVIAMAFFSGVRIFSFLEFFSSEFSSKLEALGESFSDGYYINKYPVIFRPVITFMTGVFMLPSGLKVLPVYILVLVPLTISFFKMRKKYIGEINANLKNKIGNNIVLLFSVFSTVLFFVFSLPTHANAKYYIFMMPFIFYAYSNLFGDRVIVILSLVSTILVFFGLTVFRF